MTYKEEMVYQMGYEMGKRDAAMEWISVEERLPEHEEDVLLLFETGVVAGGFLCSSDTWCAYSDGEYYTDCSNNPTHWMPLPPPPEQ